MNTFKRVIQMILYLLFQIAFIPFALIGLLIGIYKEMVIGSKMGISFSAIKTLQYRWSGHYFNIRPDSYSIEFIKKFPCESHFGLWSIMGALVISKRLWGFSTNAVELVEPEDTFDAAAITRLRVFDKIIDKYVNEVEQLVIPGVGFDLIALKYSHNNHIKVYELDQVNTLKLKIATLKKANIKHDSISYIPVDYESESWDDKLIDVGFDKSKKTLFLWQSVSLFLKPDQVKETLEKICNLCSEGSIIAQDFYSEEFLNGTISKKAKKQFNLFEKLGEPVKFGLDMAEKPKQVVKEFLSGFGLNVEEHTQFGENIGIKPFYCIVVAKKI